MLIIYNTHAVTYTKPTEYPVTFTYLSRICAGSNEQEEEGLTTVMGTVFVERNFTIPALHQ
jgi:hypothetical protein